MNYSKNLYCPSCVSLLVPGKEECFETLSDHVCNPNGDPPPRPTVTCNNPDCDAFGVFWNSLDGEGPYRVQSERKDLWIDGNPHPFCSWSRKMYFNIHYDQETSTFIMTKKYAIKREVHYESNDFGDKKGKTVKYRLIINGVYYTSGITMFLFVLRRFYKGYENADNLTREALYPNAGWWRKAVAWWVKTFHKNKLTPINKVL